MSYNGNCDYLVGLSSRNKEENVEKSEKLHVLNSATYNSTASSVQKAAPHHGQQGKQMTDSGSVLASVASTGGGAGTCFYGLADRHLQLHSVIRVIVILKIILNYYKLS